MKVPRSRLDKLLLERGLAPSRERAQAIILAGRVLVNEQKIEKPGAPVSAEDCLRLLGEEQPYVGRGGLKLEAALRHWSIQLTGRACVDVGASTGGFTDCMVQFGAATVLAIDTGYGQIAQKLRDDPRVSLRERTNARLLKPGDLPAEISFVAMDVAFISATLVLGPVLAAIAGTSPVEIVVLVKPQFEAGREAVGKGGIVRDPAAHERAIARVRECLEGLGASEIRQMDSPITGAEGNREFLLHARLRSGSCFVGQGARQYGETDKGHFASGSSF